VAVEELYEELLAEFRLTPIQEKRNF